MLRIFIYMNIMRIIKEEMDWIKDVPASLPTSDDMINQHSWEITKTTNIFNYIEHRFRISAISIFFEDGRAVEFTNDDEVLYQNYKNIRDMADDIGGSFMTMDEYIDEYDGINLITEDVFLHNKIIEIYSPIKIKGIYRIDL